ncbi:glucosaminidase domain-containing protein [Bacillus sp. BRMEA1]|uniref:glucosaminidase domain-containing protein n=1 Tax=Neobacillus endophyticus TaxID=2738405 RepID=UPI0015671D7E|nr:glucosaminidase domain-containing protein [Neobacillus endophyticus]NRD76708.1 glucosaminidase domain-containing protein [Neobacillus endophyticus]
MKKKRATAFFLATMLFSSSAVGATAVTTNTWKYQNNKWYYVTPSGKKITGWVSIKGARYYFSSDGVMQTGWARINNLWYYFDLKSGAMKTGWLIDKNTWYYLKSSGAMATGWIEVSGKKYYLSPSGAMVTGQKYIDNKPYFFTSSGALSTAKLTGWFRDGSVIMYFNTDGSKHTGWLTVSGSTYYFGTDGFMYKGWLTDNGNKYYFGQDGKMLTGIQTINGQKYYFAANGVLQQSPGWQVLNNKRYYLGTNGIVYTGWLTDGGKKYYLGSDGTMQTGWFLYQNNWYYFNSDGTMATGWISDSSKWYYLNSDGVMQTGWLVDQGNTYYLNVGGDRRTGWLQLGNSWYYFDSNGKMVTGTQVIDGKTYTFFDNGLLNSGPVTTKTQYNVTLQQVLNVEMQLNPPPQTDLYQSQAAYVSSQYVLQNANDPTKGVVTASALNVRSDTNSNSFIYGTLKQGQTVTIVSTVGTWYQIKFGTWRNAKPEDVINYLDPSRITPDSPQYLEFLILNKNAGTTAADLNANVLKGKGILDGMGDAFIKASLQNNVNEVYLIAHAFLESGNGTSALANGVQVDTVDGKKLDKPVTVYNMFGIGAFDSCPQSCGAQTAYKNGWFTPEAAIIGGAAFIGSSYINAANSPQNTLYKMRWNPANPGNHQYATDMSWAANQVYNMKKIYDSLSSYTLYFDVPVYK